MPRGGIGGIPLHNGNGSGAPAVTQEGSIVRWDFIPLGQNMFLIEPTTFSTATGAAINIDLAIPFPFKLIAILLEHCDAANALGTDALTWSFNILPRRGLIHAFPIVSYTTSIASQFYEIFGDDYVFPAATYRLIHNTTNTDRIRVLFVIQRRSISD